VRVEGSPTRVVREIKHETPHAMEPPVDVVILYTQTRIDMVNAFGTANAAAVSTAQTKFPPTQSDIATTFVSASQSAAVYNAQTKFPPAHSDIATTYVRAFRPAAVFTATTNCPPAHSAIATTYVRAFRPAAVFTAHAFE
jgi:hypothetical protein